MASVNKNKLIQPRRQFTGSSELLLWMRTLSAHAVEGMVHGVRRTVKRGLAEFVPIRGAFRDTFERDPHGEIAEQHEGERLAMSVQAQAAVHAALERIVDNEIHR